MIDTWTEYAIVAALFVVMAAIWMPTQYETWHGIIIAAVTSAAATLAILIWVGIAVWPA